MVNSKSRMAQFIRCSVSSLLLFLAACSYAPVQEMSDARQAIDAARVAGAGHYAETEFNGAQALLKKAEGQLNDGHYKEARRNAVEARHKAIEAREAAQKAALK